MKKAILPLFCVVLFVTATQAQAQDRILQGYNFPTRPGTYTPAEFASLIGVNLNGDPISTHLKGGCIGFARVALAHPSSPSIRNYPEQSSNIAGCWLNAQDAIALKNIVTPLGPQDQYAVVAIQGHWKGGRQPKANARGMVPRDSIVTATGRFNYVVYHPRHQVWVDANHCITTQVNGELGGMYVNPITKKSFFSPQRWYVKMTAPSVPYKDVQGELGDPQGVYHGMIFLGCIFRGQVGGVRSACQDAAPGLNFACRS